MSFPNLDSEHVAKSSIAKVMINNDVIFNIYGDVQILALTSECYTANNSIASRIKYIADTAHNGDTDISGLCTTLANAIIGTRVICDNTTLSSAPNVSVSGVSLNMDSRGIIVPTGAIKLGVTVGSTTGTWKHYIRWEPLEAGAYILPAF